MLFACLITGDSEVDREDAGRPQAAERGGYPPRGWELGDRGEEQPRTRAAGSAKDRLTEEVQRALKQELRKQFDTSNRKSGEVIAAVVGNAMRMGVAQALGKGGARRSRDAGGDEGRDLRSCERCQGMHLPDLPRTACPNALAFAEGRLHKLISDKVKCTFWARRRHDGGNIECCGEGHT